MVCVHLDNEGFDGEAQCCSAAVIRAMTVPGNTSDSSVRCEVDGRGDAASARELIRKVVAAARKRLPLPTSLPTLLTRIPSPLFLHPCIIPSPPFHTRLLLCLTLTHPHLSHPSLHNSLISFLSFPYPFVVPLPPRTLPL